jgi:hypothetical protein
MRMIRFMFKTHIVELNLLTFNINHCFTFLIL